MNETNKIMKISIKEISMIKNYIASRLGEFNITNFNFKIEDNNNNNEIELKQDIELKHIGIMKHIIKSCVLCVNIIPQRKSEHGIYNGIARLSFQYKHYSNGSNCHDLNFHLSFNSDNVFEVEN